MWQKIYIKEKLGKNTMCYNMQRMLRTLKKSDETSNAGICGECQKRL